jgi:hypothetical protein
MDIRSSGGVRGRDASAKDARGRVWMDAPSTGAIGTPCARMPPRVPLALASLEPRVVRTNARSPAGTVREPTGPDAPVPPDAAVQKEGETAVALEFL